MISWQATMKLAPRRKLVASVSMKFLNGWQKQPIVYPGSGDVG
jgi:hypothetical protein